MRKERARHLQQQNEYLHEIVGLVADGKATLHREPELPGHIYVMRSHSDVFGPGTRLVAGAVEIIYPPKVDRA